MEEYLEEAKEELKRADHLIYVSLKYTRTVDVFISIIERMINAFEILGNGLLQKAKEEKKITKIPIVPKLKVDKINEVYEDANVKEYTDFYLFLRQLPRQKYTRSNEFRRHVTMRVYLEHDETYDVNIDRIHEYFDKIKAFFEIVKGELSQ